MRFFVWVMVLTKLRLTFPPRTDPPTVSGFGGGSRRKGNEQEVIQGGRDREQASRGGRASLQGADVGSGVQADWRDGLYVLPLASGVRMKTNQVKRFKELERENIRLKRLLADAELDKAILREAANPNF